MVSLRKLSVYFFTSLLALCPVLLHGQSTQQINTDTWYSQPGIIGTLVLCIIILVVFSIIAVVRIGKLLTVSENVDKKKADKELKDAIINADLSEIDELLKESQQSGRYKLQRTELSGSGTIKDSRGLVNQVTLDPNNRLVDEKQIGKIGFQTDDKLSNLVLAYLGA